MIVLDTPELIAAYRLRSLIGALQIEINTGLKVSRVSLLKVAQKTYGVKARTKVAAIAELQEMYAKATNANTES